MKMPRHLLPGLTLAALAVSFTLILPARAAADNAAAVKKLFAHPTRDYATAPLWVWNDMLTEQQVRETMRDLAGQQVKQVFVHPRPGLMTPYLSADWFRLWKVALKEAGRLDMNVWIYDENSYPSGFAGGWVPELMPESRGMGLSLREAKTPPKWAEATLAVFRVEGDKAEDVSARIKAGEALPEGRYVAASIQRAANSPWHGNRCYVNLLTPGVTEKFLEVTMEPYRREIGAQFGKRVPGVFTDEPNIRPAGGLPWCEDLPQQFQKRWGYNLLEHLPSLSFEVGDWRKVSHNYYATLNDLFIERWAKPFHDYCAKYGLEFTGHYWDHEWPNCAGVPDNMAMYAWHQRPSIDCLMNQYREDTHAQFGNLRMVKELSSVANQLGAKRTLCEIYGAGGWDLRFEDMKRIGDWLAVLGVNTFDEHLSYVTLRGARKRDHPQSFSYHEPWWEAYHVNAGYLARLSVALSQGEQVNRVLVIEPTTTAWMYQGNAAELKGIGDEFFELLMALEAAHVEYDLGDEDLLARYGKPAGETVNGISAQLKVGHRSYSAVVIPPMVENLDSATKRLLSQVACVHYYGKSTSHRIDGEEKARKQTSPDSSIAPLETFLRSIPAELGTKSFTGGFSVRTDPGDKGILFHHRRQLADGQILFLVNTSIESPSSGVIESNLRGAEQWNLYTGETGPYPFEKTGEGIKAGFKLPPSGSLLLFLSKKSLKPPRPPKSDLTMTMTITSPPEIRRFEPNVLTLDYVDITAGGETRTNVYFYQASQFAFQKNGMERNPWDSAVQFKDELITKTFPADSGFTANYRFIIEGAVPKDLAIVIERPDLYSITCNGQPVSAKSGEWWLDKVFGRINLAATARVGDNVVTLKAAPFTIYHELEPAYVRGDFALKPVERGFAIVPGQPLTLGKWNEQGHPFYAAGVAYRQQFGVSKPEGRYFVTLAGWYGSVAKVLVNGKLAGYITTQPWECDVTKEIKRGPNTVEVVVIGTLKNTLGPHHNKPGLGSAWPAMFQKGPNPGPPPGVEYATVGYGLFEPFALTQRLRK